jgi:hypothetical protein
MANISGKFEADGIAQSRINAIDFGGIINLAKFLSKKMKTGHDWNSDYKTE